MRVTVLSRISPAGLTQGDRNRLNGLAAALHSLVPSVEVVVVGQDPRVRRGFSLSPAPYLWPLGYRWQGEALEGVVAFQLACAPLALKIPAKWRVLDLTDSLDWYRRQLGMRPDVLVKRVTLLSIGWEEIRLGRQFDQVWVSAAPDQAWLGRKGLETVLVPNGVRMKEKLPAGNPKALIMVGNFEYLPNRLGLKAFLENVWPVLAPLGYTLSLVGKSSDRMVCPVGVQGLGFQENLRFWYDRCGIAVSPVAVGAGSQNKILEALGYGRPVVAHAAGTLGLSCEQQSAVLRVTGTRQSWIDALSQLQHLDRYRHIVDQGFDAVPLFSASFVPAIKNFFREHP